MSKFDYFKFEFGYTKSGIPVFTKYLPWCNEWIHARIALRYGSWDNPEEKEGLAHFLEHLLFLGTKKYPTKEIIKEQADRNTFFDTLRGSTSHEVFFLSGKLVPNNFVKGFDILRDLMFFPTLNEVSFIEEKRVVLAEMWENYICQANIESSRIMRTDLYGSHVIGRKVDLTCGDEETIKNISLKDVTSTHKEYFHTGNLFFLFVGDIGLKKAISLAELVAAGAPAGPTRPPRPRPSHWPRPLLRIREISSREMMRGEFSGRTTTRISMFRMLPKNNNPYLNDVIRDIYHRLLDEKFRHEMQITYGVRVSLKERSDHDELHIWLEVDPEKYSTIMPLAEETITQFGNRKGDKKLFRETIADSINCSRILEFPSGNILDISMLEFINYGRMYSTEETHSFKKEINFNEVADYISKELSSDKLYWWVLMP